MAKRIPTRNEKANEKIKKTNSRPCYFLKYIVDVAFVRLGVWMPGSFVRGLSAALTYFSSIVPVQYSEARSPGMNFEF